ncbi:MAG: hypothetical protein ACLS4Z_04525 [Christensenellaceae bacterium]
MQTSENTQIRGLTADSRFCSTGDLFFCLTGGKRLARLCAGRRGSGRCRRRDGTRARAEDSATRRARFAPPWGLSPPPFTTVPRKAENYRHHGHQRKTTTSYMLVSVLRRAGKTVAVVGTLGIYYGKSRSRPN